MGFEQVHKLELAFSYEHYKIMLGSPLPHKLSSQYARTGSGNSLFLNWSKFLRSLDSIPSIGAQPTLLKECAALKKSLTDSGANLVVTNAVEGDKGKRKMGEENERKIVLRELI